MPDTNYELLLQRLEELLSANKITISNGKIEINKISVRLPKASSTLINRKNYYSR